MDDALKKRATVKRLDGSTATRAAIAVGRHLAAHKAEALCALLLILMAVNLLTVIQLKTITNDEIVHVPAGYYHLVEGEFQINNEHPPLVKMWAALPLLFIQPVEPPRPQDAEGSFVERTFGFHSRFWKNNPLRFETISFWSRAMMLPITLGLGLLIFLFARRLFGDAAAVFAVALYTLEPTVLAHGRVVQTDVPAALAYLLFFFTLHNYWREPSTRRAALLGLSTGFALVTKFSMVILGPVLAACSLVFIALAPRRGVSRKSALAHSLSVMLIALFIVNACYYFQSPPVDEADARWAVVRAGANAAPILSAIETFSHVLPTYFLFGIFNVAAHNHEGHPAGLLGMQGWPGWWYYFPVAFTLKTSIPFLVLTVAALAWSLWKLFRGRDYRFIIVLVPFVIYLSVSLTSKINIGLRHFLPAFPFLFILGGALLAELVRARRRFAGAGAAALLVGWMGLETARAYPNYMPYMNQLASSRPHWWYLSDSNVEWGDDVGELARYLLKRKETRVRAALSGGWATLAQHGVEYVDIVAVPRDKHPPTRYIAVGASYLNGSVVDRDEIVQGRKLSDRTEFFARFREREPEAVFGGSIYLYREGE